MRFTQYIGMNEITNLKISIYETNSIIWLRRCKHSWTESTAMSSLVYHTYKTKNSDGYCMTLDRAYAFTPDCNELDVIYSVTSMNLESIYAVEYTQWDVISLR